MARDRRMICRSSFTSKKLAKCTDSEHLLFYGLVLHADDEGRGDGDPLTLTLECANRRWSEEQVEGMMQTLRTLNLVSWYTVDGDLFYEVVDFDRYQQGSWQGKHKKESLIPKIPEGGHRVRCTRTLVSEKSVANVMECNVMESKESDISDSPLLYEKGQDPYDLADFLADLIRRNNERAKTPDLDTPAGQKWCNVFDLMIRVDKLDPAEIAAVIKWCQADDFWQDNVLSPAKLRKQYARLYAEAKKTGAPLKLRKE